MTKEVILLIQGRMAIEKYFNGHDQDRLWYSTCA